MKKYLLTLLILSLLILVACSDAETQITKAPETSAEQTETTAPDTTVAEPEVTEPDTTEIATPEITEPDTSSAPATEPYSEPNETITKTFICDSEQFKTETFKNYSHYIPALTLKNDGSMIWRVYYIGGVCDVNGTYTIDNNIIRLYCDLTGTPFEGMVPDTKYTRPYMDNYFELDIIDDNTLVLREVPDSYYNGRCYTVNPGDKFVRG